MQININLNNRPQADKINVDLQWNLEVLEPKKGFLSELFNNHTRIKRSVRLDIVDIQVPEEVICNRDNLFSILYKEQIFEQQEFPVPMVIEGMETPFQLLFHQSEIRDCKRQQDKNPRSYRISFRVRLLEEHRDIVITSERGEIDVVFEPLNLQPNFIIDLEDEDIQYSSRLRRTKVGTFVAWLNETFLFTPNQHVKINLSLFQNDKELRNLISFENKKQSETITLVGGKDKLCRLPIFIDFSDISNPVTDSEDFTIRATIELSPAYSPEVKETILKQGVLHLLKDQQGTELKTYVGFGEEKPTVCDRTHSTPEFRMHFVPRSPLTGQATIILRNIATDNTNPKAGLYINNLMLSEQIVNDIKIVGENNRLLDRFITIDGPEVNRMNSSEGLFIPNGEDAETRFTMTFDPSGIVDILNTTSYDFSIKAELSFDYWEDRNGTGILDEENKRTMRIPIKWNLHLDPNKEWLCVDYGSSAIVCLYDKEIIDLHDVKNRIFRLTKFSDDTFEKGTKFLSSDIVFHTVSDSKDSTLSQQLNSEKAIEEFKKLNLSVCLSPTSSLVAYDVNTQLPCLKILVGNKYLPDSRHFTDFKYTRRDSNGHIGSILAKDAKTRDEDTCLLKINTIFSEAYSELFKFFILPKSKDRNINKLILTYPNTYTPDHLKVLEKIVMNTFPKIRPGYLRFVSESDAVASYYLQNLERLNPTSNVRATETVLVFDMGAGTLDLTLFRKRINGEGRIEVDILGKIGTGRAGNYLDYLIAEILKDKYPTLIKDKYTVSTRSVLQMSTQYERLGLKQLIKDEIKPNLLANTDINITLPLNTDPVQTTMKIAADDILEDSRFKEFLNNISFDLIRRLLAYVNEPNLKIDTLILSGRSCRMKAIQNALLTSFQRMGFNITPLMFSGGTDRAYADREKTVVVDGAVIRATVFSAKDSPVIMRSRRLYASYGLVYEKLGGKYVYVELLSGSDTPFVTDYTNLTDFIGEPKIAKGTGTAQTIKLVQTYLSPENTEKAYNDGDMEFISDMEEFEMSNFEHADSLNVKLKLDYKNNIQLYVNGMVTKGRAPRGVDLESEITKKSIWPVTI
ncbi:MAG: hypothetical protein HDS13_08060 [Bacteroides sp.]|nr:hypothetical protein [Bacteroides sp.]